MAKLSLNRHSDHRSCWVKLLVQTQLLRSNMQRQWLCSLSYVRDDIRVVCILSVSSASVTSSKAYRENERRRTSIIVSGVKPCPHCGRKVRLSHKSETVSLLWDSLTFVRQSHFSATVWTGHNETWLHQLANKIALNSPLKIVRIIGTEYLVFRALASKCWEVKILRYFRDSFWIFIGIFLLRST